MDTISLIAFGQDVGALAHEETSVFSRAFDACVKHTINRFINPWWKIFRAIGTPSEREYARNIATLNEFAHSIIRARRRSLAESPQSDRFDLLSLFVKHAMNEGEELSDEFLRDIIMSMVIAGRDTTACVLSWMFYELFRHPDVGDKLANEFEQFVDNDGMLSFKDCPKTKYFELAFFETLRMHPSVPETLKRSIKDDVLPSGTKVPGGSYITYSPYTFGRSPFLWENADEFLPSRWDGDDNPES
eukprot:364608_1